MLSTATALEIARYLEFRAFSLEPELPLYITHAIVRVPIPRSPGYLLACRPRSEAMVSAARIILQCNHSKLVR